jgi:ATP-dependent DNA helicase RecQ
MGEVQPVLALPSPAPKGRARSRRARAGVGGRQPGPASVDTATEADPELLTRLKTWRTEEARRKAMPPYVIFHDRTLAEVAARRPRNLEELHQVPGIGPAKLEAYGAALLAILGES